MKKKKTISNHNHPLALYLGSTKAPAKKIEEKKITKNEKDIATGTKQRVTIHLSTDLINKVKDAVFWEPGLTLTDFAESALSKALEILEKKRGKKYPQRKAHNLRGGRPVT